MTLMNNIFQLYLDKFVIVYLDDILIYSKTKEKHLKHVHIILETLRKHQIYAKLSKYEFIKQRVEYTGHFSSEQGITIDLRKIDTIRN